jgi:DNA-binding response OmpR family regulator
MKQILLLEDDAGVSGVLAGLLEEEKYYVSTTTHVATRESFSKG